MEEKLLELIEKAEAMGTKGIAFVAEQAPLVVEGYLNYSVFIACMYLVIPLGCFMALIGIWFYWRNNLAYHKKLLEQGEISKKEHDENHECCTTCMGGLGAIILLVGVIFAFHHIENIAHIRLSPHTYIYNQAKKGFR